MQEQEQTEKDDDKKWSKYGVWLIFLLAGTIIGLIISANTPPDQITRTQIFHEELCSELGGTRNDEYNHCTFSDKQILYPSLLQQATGKIKP